jgi:hypothetical protein
MIFFLSNIPIALIIMCWSRKFTSLERSPNSDSGEEKRTGVLFDIFFQPLTIPIVQPLPHQTQAPQRAADQASRRLHAVVIAQPHSISMMIC